MYYRSVPLVDRLGRYDFFHFLNARVSALRPETAWNFVISSAVFVNVTLAIMFVGAQNYCLIDAVVGSLALVSGPLFCDSERSPIPLSPFLSYKREPSADTFSQQRNPLASSSPLPTTSLFLLASQLSFTRSSIASIALPEFRRRRRHFRYGRLAIRKRVLCLTNHYPSLAVLRQKKIGT